VIVTSVSADGLVTQFHIFPSALHILVFVEIFKVEPQGEVYIWIASTIHQ